MMDAEIPVLLVGDSAANVVYGYDTTVPISIDELIPLVRGVVRGAPHALVIADLPFGSYEAGAAQALDERVALLEGLSADAIRQCLDERVTLTDGARTLVQTMRAGGATAILVSGGFTHFAEPVGNRIGFDRVIANRLEIADGALTGKVARPIVDASTKQRTLVDARRELALPDEATLCVGDGANDLDMIRLAGLGVAFHAKPVVAAAAGARIDHTDLTALLYAQGIARADWVEAD